MSRIPWLCSAALAAWLAAGLAGGTQAQERTIPRAYPSAVESEGILNGIGMRDSASEQFDSLGEFDAESVFGRLAGTRN